MDIPKDMMVIHFPTESHVESRIKNINLYNIDGGINPYFLYNKKGRDNLL